MIYGRHLPPGVLPGPGLCEMQPNAVAGAPAAVRAASLDSPLHGKNNRQSKRVHETLHI